MIISLLCLIVLSVYLCDCEVMCECVNVSMTHCVIWRLESKNGICELWKWNTWKFNEKREVFLTAGPWASTARWNWSCSPGGTARKNGPWANALGRRRGTSTAAARHGLPGRQAGPARPDGHLYSKQERNVTRIECLAGVLPYLYILADIYSLSKHGIFLRKILNMVLGAKGSKSKEYLGAWWNKSRIRNILPYHIIIFLIIGALELNLIPIITF
jgi:hypothetical protein